MFFETKTPTTLIKRAQSSDDKVLLKNNLVWRWQPDAHYLMRQIRFHPCIWIFSAPVSGSVAVTVGFGFDKSATVIGVLKSPGAPPQ